MWILVMFDLPVVLAEERKAANDFRHLLLNLGFEMSQLSVYMRFCTSPAQLETYCKHIEESLPPGGNVKIIQITDKQYERIINFRGKSRQEKNKMPDLFELL